METQPELTADDFTIWIEVERDLNVGGDETWHLLYTAETLELPAMMPDGIEIHADDVPQALQEHETMVLARLRAVGEAHGWQVEKYDPAKADGETRKLRRMDPDTEDVIRQDLMARYNALWEDVVIPTGAEINAAI